MKARDAVSLVCHRCHREQPAAAFYLRRRPYVGRLQPCRNCILVAKRNAYVPHPRVLLDPEERKRRHMIGNRESARRRMARLRADPVIGPAIKAADRKRLEAWRAEHPDYVRERARVRGHISSRKDMPKHFSPKDYLTRAQWKNIVVAFGGKCAYCDQTTELVRDHVIPIARGGKHVAENIVPSCRPCNEKKCAQDVRAWLNNEDRYQFIGDMVASYA